MDGFFSGATLYSGFEYMKYMLILIRLLRERGFSRQLRAGQSGFTLMLSRSYEHGLRPEQPFLTFTVFKQGSMIVTFEAQNIFVRFFVAHVELTPEIENLLIPLLVYPID